MSLLYKTYSLILVKLQPFLCIHICTHLDDDIFICLEANVLMQLDAHTLTCFDDYAEMQSWLDDKMYVDLDA